MKFGVYTLVIENYMKRIPEVIFDFGWGMGYILLPPRHPLYGKPYDEIDIRIHGGLTYGGKFTNNNFLEWIKGRKIFGDVTRDNYENFNNYWIIGFDTSHYGDTLDSCSLSYVMYETTNLLNQCLDDSIERMKEYKSIYFRKDKLKEINASVLAMSSKHYDA